MHVTSVKPLERRVWPWERWSNWVVTYRPDGSIYSERETGRHCFRWWAQGIADHVQAQLPPEQMMLTIPVDLYLCDRLP